MSVWTLFSRRVRLATVALRTTSGQMGKEKLPWGSLPLSWNIFVGCLLYYILKQNKKSASKRETKINLKGNVSTKEEKNWVKAVYPWAARMPSFPCEKIKELFVRNSSFSLRVLRNQCQCLENRSYHIIEVACTILGPPTLWLLPSIQDYLVGLRPLGLLLNLVFILWGEDVLTWSLSILKEVLEQLLYPASLGLLRRRPSHDCGGQNWLVLIQVGPNQINIGDPR